jgi:hypothetical protein
MSAERKRHRIAGQFIAHPVELLKSSAYRVLNIHERRVLTRIEIEHAAHAGKDNGRLPVTFQDFQDHGVTRKYVGAAIAVLEALGLLEVTEKGRASNGEFRAPSLYRLTYLRAYDSDPTNEWRRIKTISEAEVVIAPVRRREPRERRRPPARGAKPRIISATSSA